MLDQSKRDQLNQLIGRMKDNQEDDASIRAMVEQFKAKYDTPEAAAPTGGIGGGHEAEGAFGERDPQAEKSSLFPSAIKEYENRFSQPAGSVGQSLKDFGAVGLAGLDDVAGLAQRGAAAALTDQKMSDPGAHALKAQTDAAVEAARNRAKTTSGPPGYVPPGVMWQPPELEPAATEFLGRTIDDPANYLAAIPKAAATGLRALEKAIPGITKAAEALHRWNGRSAERLSGVPLETLEAYRDPAKRALMKDSYGKEIEIGNEILDNVNNYEQFLPEIQKIDEALKDMPPISTEGAVKAMQAAKQKPVAGVYSPIDQAGNAKADPWIDFIRGGPEPEDLSRSTSQAMRDLEQAQGTAKATGAQAKVDTREAERALKLQGKAQQEAGRTANEVKNLPDKGKGFWRWHENEENAAKEAAGKAREAAIDARAKLATGEISKADYAAAKAAEASAARNLDVVASARKLFNGQPLKEVARDLSKDGMKMEDIRDVLSKARDRAQSIPELETTIPAKDYREKRKRLDANIDFDNKEDGIVDRIQKAGRTEMMQTLERVAEESGNPEFRAWMKSYAGKAKLIDDFKAYVGQTKGTRERKIEGFVNNLFGRNSQHKQEMMKALDQVMGGDVLKRAKAAQQAAEIGHSGGASLFSMHNNGAMGAGQQWLGRIAPFWSSPMVASRVTLPAFSKVESLAKKLGNAIPPRANKLIMAIEKADNPAKAAPLVNQLIQLLEVEAQMPANAIPFPRKVAEKEDNTRYSRK